LIEICFELQCSEELQTAHTTNFPYTIDGVPFWMRYYMFTVSVSQQHVHKKWAA